MIDDYTRLLEATVELAPHGSEHADFVADEAVKKLVAHLRSLGRAKMLPKVLYELRKVAARRRALAPVVEVAHKDEADGALREAAAAGIRASHARINTSLIRGWRGRSDGLLIDRSAKRALVEIYQNVAGA